MFVLTGGSSVYDGKWTGCDEAFRKELLKSNASDIKIKVGTFLLARGLVNDAFGYYRHDNLLVIQSRKHWDDVPAMNIFTSSLIKLVTDYPREYFLIHSPIKDKERLIKMRSVIAKYLGAPVLVQFTI